MVKQFCESILQQKIGRSKSLTNLVMGLASQTNAKSVVETSLSRCYHFQHSSINKAIDSIYKGQERLKEIKTPPGQLTGRQEVEKKFVHESGIH